MYYPEEFTVICLDLQVELTPKFSFYIDHEKRTRHYSFITWHSNKRFKKEGVFYEAPFETKLPGQSDKKETVPFPVTTAQ